MLIPTICYSVHTMTSKSMLVQVRMPIRLVEALDRLSDEGIYMNRSEAILDGVRRIIIAFEKKDQFREALAKSYLGRKRTGTIEEINHLINPDDIVECIREAFGTDQIDHILQVVRR